MSSKTGAAALDSICQWSLLCQRRAPRHPTGGSTRETEQVVRAPFFVNLLHTSERTAGRPQETHMNRKIEAVDSNASLFGIRRSIRRRLMGALLLAAFGLVLPGVAAAAPMAHKQVRAPRLDRRAIESLQHWVSGGHDSWCKDAQLVASAEMQRLVPEFSGYQFELASLPLEKEIKAPNRAVFSYTSIDGRTTYRVTVRRYAWLLPEAGDPHSIVWVPARTEIISNE
jgi:hypothetical protein